MQLLQTPHQLLFTFPPPKTLNPSPHSKPQPPKWTIPYLSPLTFTHSHPANPFKPKAFSSDEFPVDETFLQNFGPKDKETEDEALNEGEEVALQSPEAIEAFKMLRPSYRKKKMEDMGLTEDDYYRKQFEIKGNIPEPLETVWAGPPTGGETGAAEGLGGG